MRHRFLNTRIPSILSALAFVLFSLLFVHSLMGAREAAAATQEVLRGLLLWGSFSLLAMLAFCLCLMKVTRYRRCLPGKPSRSGSHPE